MILFFCPFSYEACLDTHCPEIEEELPNECPRVPLLDLTPILDDPAPAPKAPRKTRHDNRKQFRNVCFTINENANPARAINLHERLLAAPQVKYSIFSLEKAPETEHMHFQGYMELKQSLLMNPILEILDDQHAFIQARSKFSTAKKASDYCEKSETHVMGPWKTGTLSTQGRRTDLEAVHQSIKDGKSLREIADLHFEAFASMGSNIIKCFNLLGKQRDRALKPSVWLFAGVPDCGKTFDARAALIEVHGTYYEKSSGTKWFENYCGELGVIFDDFGGSTLTCGFLKQLLDSGQWVVEVKGTYINWMAESIILTSNSLPDMWFPHKSQLDINAIYRRFSGVRIYYQRSTYEEIKRTDDPVWINGSHMHEAVQNAWHSFVEPVMMKGQIPGNSEFFNRPPSPHMGKGGEEDE